MYKGKFLGEVRDAKGNAVKVELSPQATSYCKKEFGYDFFDSLMGLFVQYMSPEETLTASKKLEEERKENKFSSLVIRDVEFRFICDVDVVENNRVELTINRIYAEDGRSTRRKDQVICLRPVA